MTKKEDKHDSMFDKIKTVAGTVSDIFFPQLAKGAGEILDTVESKALVIEAKIVQKLTAAATIGVAFIFLMFAGLFYLIEYRGISKALAFLIVGLIVLLFGMYMQIKSLLEEKKEK